MKPHGKPAIAASVARAFCFASLAFAYPSFAIAARAPASVVQSTSQSTWLFASDIHLDPRSTTTEPNRAGGDTNPALFASALAAMKAADPDPPVVVIGGDLLAHRIDSSLAISTMQAVARGFGATFPHAHFVVALGNNDSECGDYQVGFDSPFLRAAATAFAPLVDRDGAAPDFAKSFAHDGFARVKLPLANTTALVVDDTFWTPRYSDACKTNARPDAVFGELKRAIDTGPPGEQYWIVMHVPPGVDAYSTHFSRGVVDIPFLRPSFRDAFVGLARSGRVKFAFAAHSHKFSYRIVGGDSARAFPLVLIPAVSPIFHDAPAFLTARVSPGGAVSDVVEHALGDTGWNVLGGFRSLGVDTVSAPALRDLSARLRASATLRKTYANLYDAGGQLGITETNWQIYVCASTELEPRAYRACTGRFGFDPLSPRGIAFGVAAVSVAAALVVAIVVVVLGVTRRRRRGVAR